MTGSCPTDRRTDAPGWPRQRCCSSCSTSTVQSDDAPATSGPAGEFAHDLRALRTAPIASDADWDIVLRALTQAYAEGGSTRGARPADDGACRPPRTLGELPVILPTWCRPASRLSGLFRRLSKQQVEEERSAPAEEPHRCVVTWLLVSLICWTIWAARPDVDASVAVYPTPGTVVPLLGIVGVQRRDMIDSIVVGSWPSTRRRWRRPRRSGRALKAWSTGAAPRLIVLSPRRATPRGAPGGDQLTDVVRVLESSLINRSRSFANDSTSSRRTCSPTCSRAGLRMVSGLGEAVVDGGGGFDGVVEVLRVGAPVLQHRAVPRDPWRVPPRRASARARRPRPCGAASGRPASPGHVPRQRGERGADGVAVRRAVALAQQRLEASAVVEDQVDDVTLLGAGRGRWSRRHSP